MHSQSTQTSIRYFFTIEEQMVKVFHRSGTTLDYTQTNIEMVSRSASANPKIEEKLRIKQTRRKTCAK